MHQLSKKICRTALLLSPLLVIAAPARAQVVISEFMADNGETLLDEDGESSDWIELHNTTGAVLDLAGWRLTDDETGWSFWTLPTVTLSADGYLVIFASAKDRFGSELHTNFRLSATGEYLALLPAGSSTPSTEFSPAYPGQFEDVSYGLSGSGLLGYLSEPTPGAANADEFHAARDVDFDLARGFFDAPISVTLTCEEDGAELRYSMDGSVPDAGSGLVYTSPLVLSSTTCLRAVAIVDGMAPSPVSTRSYLFTADVLAQDQAGAVAAGFPAEWIEEDGTPWTSYGGGTHPGAWYGYDSAVLTSHSEEELEEALLSIPSVSLVMSIDDWFGYNPPAGPFGIYSNLSSAGDEWERAVSMEWIDPQTGEGTQIDCEVSMQGGSGSSITWASQGSIEVKFKKSYGPGELNYAIFDDIAVGEFDGLIFDAGNQNSIHANTGVLTKLHAQGMRDQFMMDLQASLDRPGPAGRHVHVFLNGLYWGLYNLHETPDENWCSNHFDGGSEEYDWVKEGAVRAGNSNAHDHPTAPGSWRTAIAIASNGLDVGDQWGGIPSYEALAEHIDLANYADYMLINFYGGNLDWPAYNWMATSHARNSVDWNDVNLAGRFRFHTWDAETVLGWEGVSAVGDGWYDRTSVGQNFNPGSAAFFYGRLRDHPEFRMLVADRAQSMMAPGGGLHVEEGARVSGTPYVQGRNAPADLYHQRSSQIRTAVKLEYARWGNYFHTSGSVSSADWEVERARLLEDYFPVRTDVLLQQLRAATPSLYPTIDAPALSRYGGHVSSGFELEISASAGGIYYTLDGSDPRQEGGAISASALLYSDPVAIDGGWVVLKARALSAGEWSALTEAGFSQVRISEVMAKNQTVVADEMGEFEDWIELHNESSQSVDLAGWFLSDKELDPTQWEFPTGSLVGPGGTLLLWADDDEGDGPMHTSFRLSDEGEGLYLSAPLAVGAQLVDSVRFGAQEVDRSHGRMPTTGEVFVSLIDPSPDSLNEPQPGEAVRFAAIGEPVSGPFIQATGLPFTGQVVSLLIQGFNSGAVGLLRVGRLVGGDGELIGERMGAFELVFQADTSGTASLSLLLPRWSSRLRPVQAAPANTLYYLQATNRSDATHAIAVCVQN